MTDDALDERVRDLHDHLEATASLPIDPRANRWLGEAEAVARDAATGDLDAATTRKRVRQVTRLLAEAEGTGHEAADAHVEAARGLCEEILAE
ncbi:hypothetical protein [Salinilacihabitans rarus]|uniref:hypothetical protein n=1 Tax=Salinilacihabitans rarus TaxID=2961596 RepID=UPI0020C919E6|nr:hypothetical protein [Salinilacihabitans rarus]